MSITDISAILVGIAAIAGFGFGLWEFRRKIDLKLFRIYTEKYNAIITPKIHDQWNNACKAGHPNDWKGLDETAIAYLNLVWEEIYLQQTGMIRCNIWKIWWPEIKNVLESDFGKEMVKTHGFKNLEIEKLETCQTCPRFQFPSCAVKRMISDKDV